MSSVPSPDRPESARAHPKVSVALITYNHEKFIAQAVESVMMQQTNFDYELVVGEDCSTDSTRQILLELKNKYPERIKLLLHDKNLGAIMNFKQTLNACRGQYLAILDGDDYWILPHKLQKQVDALDKNPDWSICTHRNLAFYEDGSKPPYLWPQFNPKPVYTLDDFLRGGFVGTPASVYRKSAIDSHPDWIFQAGNSDYALELFYAQHGKIGFIDEVMSAYRKHGGGTWFQRDELKQKTKMAHCLIIIARHMGWRHRRILKAQAAQQLLKVVSMHLAEGSGLEARKVMSSIFPGAYCLPGIPWRRLSRTGLMVYAPWSVPILRRVKLLIFRPKLVGKA